MKFAVRSAVIILFFITVGVVYLNTKATLRADSGIAESSTRLENLRVRETQEIKKKKIAYAITVTKDGPFVDGAIVLGYSALKVHDKNMGFNSKYDAELVAFVVPSVVTSRPLLESHGWKLVEKTVPVTLDEIENKKYVEQVYELIYEMFRSLNK